VGRVKTRREYTSKIVNSTIRLLIKEHPPVIAVAWLTMFDEFGVSPIIPSRLPSERRYRTSIGMLRLMGHGLAEELPEVRNQSWAGRPAKAYRLLIPSP